MHKLVIVSGPSGCGKTTIMRSLMKNEIVSFTTREQRKGEVEGVDYIYITQEYFKHLRETGGLAEHTTYYGSSSYGITMEELTVKLGRGNAFVIVDVVGMEQLKVLYANHVTVFIRADIKEAKLRMESRGDTLDKINSRLKTFEEELDNYYLYDYILENTGELEDSILSMKLILETEGIFT